MRRTALKTFDYRTVVLDGIPYAILRESLLQALCRRAGVQLPPASTAQVVPADPLAGTDLDRAGLARRLVDRRKRAGLTQAGLARAAGVRVETLNRIERGKHTPDFATVRKLVVAMQRAEASVRNATARADAAAIKEYSNADDPRAAR